MKYHHSNDSSLVNFPSKRLILSILLCCIISLFLTIFSFKHMYTFPPPSPPPPALAPVRVSISGLEPTPQPQLEPTNLKHIVFGIGAAANKWGQRKEFIQLWWRSNITRGYVFLDHQVKLSKTEDPNEYPTLKVSEDTSRIGYSPPRGSARNGVRITRIVSELVRMKLEDVRWFVMADDDTIFFPDNLVRVLQKYDHTKMYYIGSNSETHIQNVYFAYDMAFGGGGFAISYPLAKAIEQMQDRCLQRYPSLYGSDDRIQACVAELGVPLTKEPGFHQCDVYGNLFGILTSHPVAPLVSLHHLEIVDPIFPNLDRLKSLQHLHLPTKLDSESLMQQSICYDAARNWTISVSWGYAVQIYLGSIPPREMQQPARTFFNWHKKDDPSGFAFNTRPFSKHPCQKPYIYYFSNGAIDPMTSETTSEYVLHQMPHPWCWWKIENPDKFHKVEVYKKHNPHKWEEAPRRDCCRVINADKPNTIAIDVGECIDGEVIEPQLS